MSSSPVLERGAPSRASRAISRTIAARRFFPSGWSLPPAPYVFVSGIGTGGTITGVSRYIKNDRGKAILSVGVAPPASPVCLRLRYWNGGHHHGRLALYQERSRQGDSFRRGGASRQPRMSSSPVLERGAPS